MKQLMRIIIIIFCFSPIFMGCSNKVEDEVMYIASDEWGSVVVFNEKEKYLLVASIRLNDLLTFRENLRNNSLKSDNLGALQYLYSLPYDYLIEGNKEAWKSVYQESQLSHCERVNYIIGGSDDLSKIINTDTLESLIGKNTSGSDVMKVYRNLKKDDYLLRVYMVSQFFQASGDISLNKRNMGEWLIRALEEIRRK